MTDIEPLPLFHSWPLFDAAAHIELGRLGAAFPEGVATAPGDLLAEGGIGIWRCDLADESLHWTPAVYALFGLPLDQKLTRKLTLSCYPDRSRVAMEQLRTHAIRHRRGFTLDVQLRRPDGDQRWMRLSTLPVLLDGKVVRLCGTKEDVTECYDGAGQRAV